MFVVLGIKSLTRNPNFTPFQNPGGKHKCDEHRTDRRKLNV